MNKLNLDSNVCIKCRKERAAKQSHTACDPYFSSAFSVYPTLFSPPSTSPSSAFLTFSSHPDHSVASLDVIDKLTDVNTTDCLFFPLRISSFSPTFPAYLSTVHKLRLSPCLELNERVAPTKDSTPSLMLSSNRSLDLLRRGRTQSLQALNHRVLKMRGSSIALGLSPVYSKSNQT